MTYAPLFEATDFFTPYPDPRSVFSRDIETHAKYLLPLASIELSHIDPKLAGRVHFIQTIEPHDGVVGEGGDASFNFYCRENYVGYRFNDSGLCELATDFSYFAFDRSPQDRPLSDHYQDVHVGFAKAREHYHVHKALHGPYGRSPFKPEDRVELIKNVGSPCEGGNWAESGDFPLLRGTVAIDGEEIDHIVPVTDDGRPFLFIGQLSAYNYILSNRSALGYDLVLFYDPVTRTGLTTFDWYLALTIRISDR